MARLLIIFSFLIFIQGCSVSTFYKFDDDLNKNGEIVSKKVPVARLSCYGVGCKAKFDKDVMVEGGKVWPEINGLKPEL